MQQHYLALKTGRGTLPTKLQRVKKTLLACGVPHEATEDARLLHQVGSFFGYPAHHLDFKSILVDVERDGGDGGLHGSKLLVALDNACQRKTRKDKLAGHPVFQLIWHSLTVPHKGQKQTRKMLRQKDIISLNGKMRAVSVFVTHQSRIMENTMKEIHQEMLSLPCYLSFRKDYMQKNPKLPPDWQVC